MSLCIMIVCTMHRERVLEYMLWVEEHCEHVLEHCDHVFQEAKKDISLRGGVEI